MGQEVFLLSSAGLLYSLRTLSTYSCQGSQAIDDSARNYSHDLTQSVACRLAWWAALTKRSLQSRLGGSGGGATA